MNDSTSQDNSSEETIDCPCGFCNDNIFQNVEFNIPDFQLSFLPDNESTLPPLINNSSPDPNSNIPPLELMEFSLSQLLNSIINDNTIDNQSPKEEIICLNDSLERSDSSSSYDEVD